MAENADAMKPIREAIVNFFGFGNRNTEEVDKAVEIKSEAEDDNVSVTPNVETLATEKIRIVVGTKAQNETQSE